MDYRDLENNDINYEKLQEDLIFLAGVCACVKIIKIILKMFDEGKFDIDNT